MADSSSLPKVRLLWPSLGWLWINPLCQDQVLLPPLCTRRGGAIQNHGMVQPGKAHSGSSGPSSLLIRVSLKQMAQDCVQTVLEYLQ